MFNHKIFIIFPKIKNHENDLFKKNSLKSGFTIIEILVVIMIITILATISIVSYSGITQKAIVSSIQNDLTNAAEQLKTTKIISGSYPVSIIDCPTPATGNLCLKLSDKNVVANYLYDNATATKGYCVNITNGTYSYKISSSTVTTPAVGTCAAGSW